MEVVTAVVRVMSTTLVDDMSVVEAFVEVDIVDTLEAVELGGIVELVLGVTFVVDEPTIAGEKVLVVVDDIIGEEDAPEIPDAVEVSYI